MGQVGALSVSTKRSQRDASLAEIRLSTNRFVPSPARVEGVSNRRRVRQPNEANAAQVVPNSGFPRNALFPPPLRGRVRVGGSETTVAESIPVRYAGRAGSEGNWPWSRQALKPPTPTLLRKGGGSFQPTPRASTERSQRGANLAEIRLSTNRFVPSPPCGGGLRWGVRKLRSPSRFVIR